MSTPCAVPPRARLPWHKKVLPAAAAGVAAGLARLSPKSLRAVMEVVRRNARAATAAEASAARSAVVAVSLRCAVDGCLQRSIATALLCRVRGTWPTWCVGVRTIPFGAHAWVSVDGRMIDEGVPDDTYRPLITIGPMPTHVEER
ncbi:lasso peptide biosynthesis B2 protein [Saccharothrix obliqua]|uniref:lasso peptide biosynthesis B2 protein n=1 Tax=Saccharothrix obliqua TaxID=2861747 RepID=UPI001C5EDA6D|nr:lasso peptide biosynthesis B2 protein [Saccharothrix obliqua]MBW4718142.1 lasso peptide biosynthesis B2 protein [Saccharothrix obliqua]